MIHLITKVLKDFKKNNETDHNSMSYANLLDLRKLNIETETFRFVCSAAAM